METLILIWFRNLNPGKTRYGLETLILGQQDMV